jgi:hypothetical protein
MLYLCFHAIRCCEWRSSWSLSSTWCWTSFFVFQAFFVSPAAAVIVTPACGPSVQVHDQS